MPIIGETARAIDIIFNNPAGLFFFILGLIMIGVCFTLNIYSGVLAMFAAAVFMGVGTAMGRLGA